MANNTDVADSLDKELLLIDLEAFQNIEQLFYKPVKAKPMMAADKSIPYIALDEYSEQNKKNWAKSKIIIYESEMQLRKFIKQAKESKIIDDKIYFGKISKGIAEIIKAETKSDIDVEGYNLSISAYEIRKIFNSHGNETTEELRGQRAISEDDIVNIPLIVLNPDKISLSDELYEGRPVIIFAKTINGRTILVSYASKKSHDLRVQTMYSGKANKKAEPLPRR